MKLSPISIGHLPLIEPLKVGIAGYGVVGQRRRHFIDLEPRLEVKAVCDRNFSETDASKNNVLRFPDYNSLLKEDLDILFVCMTNDMAPMVTIAGLEKGLHVFCEKPPGRNVSDINSVIKTEKLHPGLKLKYGFNHRYHDSVRDALALVQSGELGRILNLRGVYGKSKFVSFGKHSDWRTERRIAGGGILLDQGIHMVDLMHLFAGDDFQEIHSFVSNDFWKHDVEDNAYALMRSNRGVVAMLHSTATQWRHRFSLEITMERGGANLSGILSGSKSYGSEELTVIRASDDDLGNPEEITSSYTSDNSWRDEIGEFADAIINDTPIINGSSNDALLTMRTVYRIYKGDHEWAQKWKLDQSSDIGQNFA